MTKKIKLDIISDVVCPWCIVGFNHLNAAIEELGLQDNVDIVWQPFELNPDMPSEGEELRAHVARKYGSSKEDSDRARANITKAGVNYGFEFNYFDGMKIVNTFDAHILLDYAHSVGKQMDLKMRLFSAFFTEKKDVSKQEVLLEEAGAVGISREKAIAALNNEEIKQKVRTLEAQWQQLGVSGVPTVVFDRTSALTGAQPQENFKQVLQELAQQHGF
ncbi:MULTISPECIES: DsbA family oxidoreductase [Alteromonadales]|uniref:DsbA family oxidoreductase n=1 Tax=Alteromonadales TaxID=135622 RepID=UPI00129DD383|nr:MULTISPECIES: DsbA family oxidoreductase [Alteromonadales]MCK8120439.1 DsbA family oxidoreductase [Pseudoalteromonas sp. 2CM32C]